jgi:hydroxyacylglutathione hydrolase
MKVAENFYLYLWSDARENNCNSIFIDGKTPLLIDPGHLHRTNDLFRRMEADGLDPRTIQVVICTHGHPDHFEGTLAFAKAKVKIGISRREEQYIEEIGRPMYEKQGKQMPDYRVDFFLKEGELTLGKHQFEIIETPGHSPGGLCIYWPRYRVLFSGDTVFMQGVGRVDMPGGDPRALKESVLKLEKLLVELVVPGHGGAVQGAAQVRQNYVFIKQTLFRQI